MNIWIKESKKTFSPTLGKHHKHHTWLLIWFILNIMSLKMITVRIGRNLFMESTCIKKVQKNPNSVNKVIIICNIHSRWMHAKINNLGSVCTVYEPSVPLITKRWLGSLFGDNVKKTTCNQPKTNNQTNKKLARRNTLTINTLQKQPRK